MKITENKVIKLTIPVYYTNSYKTKKDKTFLVSLNWYRNAYYHEQNKVKLFFYALIKTQLTGNKVIIDNTYKIEFTYFYKNVTSDMPNVTSMCSKWVNDVLQDLDIVNNDNVKYLLQETHKVADQDKDNPRCEISITKI